MPSLGHIKVWIEVDGKPLEEYRIARLEDEYTVSCYIASEVGKEFVVKAQDLGGLSDQKTRLKAMSTFDGIIKSNQIGDWRGNLESPGLVISETEIRPYRFSLVDISDAVNAQHNSQLGTVDVDVDIVRYLGVMQARHTPNVDFDSPLHERSKKMAAHRVALGDVKNTIRRTFADVTKLQQHATKHFHFKYFPKDLLRAQGIIEQPRILSSSASPEGDQSSQSSTRRAKSVKREATSDDEEDISGLSPEDLADYRRLKALVKKKKTKKIKTEVKQEPTSRNLSTTTPVVIDLT